MEAKQYPQSIKS